MVWTNSICPTTYTFNLNRSEWTLTVIGNCINIWFPLMGTKWTYFYPVFRDLTFKGKADISTCTFPRLDKATLTAVTQLRDKHLTQILWQFVELNLYWCYDSGLSGERLSWCGAVLNPTCQCFLLEWSFCWHTAVKSTFLQSIKHSCKWITKSGES